MTLRGVKSTIGDVLYRQVGRASSHVQRHKTLPVDVLESDDDYLVVFDAPAVERDDVQVRYVEGGVKIRLDRSRFTVDGFRMRFPGRAMTLTGRTSLPDGATVDPDSATARLTETGSLRVHIPKESGDADERETATESEADSTSAGEESDGEGAEPEPKLTADSVQNQPSNPERATIDD